MKFLSVITFFLIVSFQLVGQTDLAAIRYGQWEKSEFENSFGKNMIHKKISKVNADTIFVNELMRDSIKTVFYDRHSLNKIGSETVVKTMFNEKSITKDSTNLAKGYSDLNISSGSFYRGDLSFSKSYNGYRFKFYATKNRRRKKKGTYSISILNENNYDLIDRNDSTNFEELYKAFSKIEESSINIEMPEIEKHILTGLFHEDSTGLKLILVAFSPRKKKGKFDKSLLIYKIDTNMNQFVLESEKVFENTPASIDVLDDIIKRTYPTNNAIVLSEIMLLNFDNGSRSMFLRGGMDVGTRNELYSSYLMLNTVEIKLDRAFEFIQLKTDSLAFGSNKLNISKNYLEFSNGTYSLQFSNDYDTPHEGLSLEKTPGNYHLNKDLLYLELTDLSGSYKTYTLFSTEDIKAFTHPYYYVPYESKTERKLYGFSCIPGECKLIEIDFNRILKKQKGN